MRNQAGDYIAERKEGDVNDYSRLDLFAVVVALAAITVGLKFVPKNA